MEEKKTKTVLFVCTGNTCRSPMAEALANDYLRKKNGDSSCLRIVSAGLAALPGASASPQAREVMLEFNLDLSAHRARQLTPELLQEADLILTMTNGHKRYIQEILNNLPNKVKNGEKTDKVAQDDKADVDDKTDVDDKADKEGKVYLLPEYAAGTQAEILDPFGQSLEVYRACAAELAKYVPQALERFIFYFKTGKERIF